MSFNSFHDSVFQVPTPVNEPVRTYAPGSLEVHSLKERLSVMEKETVEVPLVIGGKEIRTGKTQKQVMPHSHGEVIAEFHLAGPKEMQMAAEAAVKAQDDWEALGWEDRVSIFLKVADLLAGPHRDTLNAATMLGQSKNCFQAEIDAACELIDFLRFNASFYQDILAQQPNSSAGIWNRIDYRPLEGFVLAITPFNFTAIAGNLPSAPAMLGNTAIWKPSRTQVLSGWYFMEILKEAGLPDGVINFLPSSGTDVSAHLLPSPDLAGVHFTGSTGVFQNIYSTIGSNIQNYKSYPRIVGETGGKDFIFAHETTNIDELVAAAVRGAFEYQGQKCSAASRMYVPSNLWGEFKEKLVSEIKTIKMGDVRDFSNYMNAVIDQSSFNKIKTYIDHANQASDAEILVGGGSDDSKGYFVEPTVIVTTNPKYKSMVEEIFGPVLTIFVYENNKLDETLELCDTSSAYALTGSIFGRDRDELARMSARLRHAAGNFYINDKPTGAVVGQQPFGGGRASGTNDKAGSFLNLIRWLSPRTIKETLVPPKDYRYPFHAE